MASAAPHSDLLESLHAAGRRLTPQRALVLDILQQADGHLDAEAIWQQARARDANLNLATVYRTLAVLKEMGLIEQRYFARDHKREFYEAVGKAEHYHFTCLRCGRVLELETPRIRQARAELEAVYGLRLAHACICFEGYCADCAQAAEAAGDPVPGLARLDDPSPA
jgi:Fe2+ or Zn2+ uptake regulation protein